MTQRKRIGFKHYDESSVVAVENNATENNVPAVAENENKSSMAISPAQAEILENIKNLSEIIVDKSFAKFAEEQRTGFVLELMKNVALNAELTVKTIMIINSEKGN
jgi:hypothetical protein